MALRAACGRLKKLKMLTVLKTVLSPELLQNPDAPRRAASDGSTSEHNALTMDSFRDELATAISLVWKQPTKFIILILHVNLECEFAM